MRHVRVRLAAMRTELFGTFMACGSGGDARKDDTWVPIEAPHLQTLVINCRSGFDAHGLGYRTRLCSGLMTTENRDEGDSWLPLAHAAEQFARSNATRAGAPLAKVCIIKPTITTFLIGPNNLPCTIISADVLCQATHAFLLMPIQKPYAEPRREIRDENELGAIRASRDMGGVGSLPAIDSIIEGQAWMI